MYAVNSQMEQWVEGSTGYVLICRDDTLIVILIQPIPRKRHIDRNYSSKIGYVLLQLQGN